MKDEIEQIVQRQRLSLFLSGLLASGLLLAALASCSGGSSGSGGGGEGTTPIKPSASFLNVDPATPITLGITDFDVEDPISEAEISVDAFGRVITRTIIEITFHDTVTIGDVKRVLSSNGAVPISAIAEATSVVVRIPDPGTLDALDAFIAQVKSDPAVWFVEKDIRPKKADVPPEYLEPNLQDITRPIWGKIKHHLAVHAHGAWAARGALNRFGPPNLPAVVVMDYFGDGIPNANLNANIVAADFSTGSLDSHGYHVLGIIAGTFGGVGEAGLVTGMMPGTIDLRVVDLQKKVSGLQMTDRLLRRINEFPQGVKVVVSTSLGYDCDRILAAPPFCVDSETAKQRAVKWIQKSKKLESRMLHLTGAGNSDPPGFPLMNAVSSSAYATAAIRQDLANGAGKPVPPLTNTLVIENDASTDGTSGPFKAKCLFAHSYVEGNLGAIGTNVWSFSNSGRNGMPDTGTSMATPQVAGLAAYLWALKPTLTVQDLKSILIGTARPVPNSPELECNSYQSPSPIIDAYAAVLALDGPAAPIRSTLLDIANDSGAPGPDGHFTYGDLTLWLSSLPLPSSKAQLDYSRYDLNGDGYTGGSSTAAFDLNINFPNPLGQATQTIAGREVIFDESAVTDLQILCYYAYSNLYQGDSVADAATAKRDSLLKSSCASSGIITTVAGTGVFGYSGDGGPATSAQLHHPIDVALDAVGNLYIADAESNHVRRVDVKTRVITTVAGGGVIDNSPGNNSGDGGPATSARLWVPHSIALDAGGNLYIADAFNNRVRRVDAQTHVIGTVAGTGDFGYGGDGGPATSASLYRPRGVALDAAGNLYISDSDNARVRRVDAQTHVITTVAGTGVRGMSGDGGPATSARVNSPRGVALDAAGNLYFSDSDNARVRRVDAQTHVITTVAGGRPPEYDEDNQPAINAYLDSPDGIALDSVGNLYIAEGRKHRVRRVDAQTQVITTVSGIPPIFGYNGDNQPATKAWLKQPFGVALDAAGNLYIADTFNGRVRRVTK